MKDFYQKYCHAFFILFDSISLNVEIWRLWSNHDDGLRERSAGDSDVEFCQGLGVQTRAHSYHFFWSTGWYPVSLGFQICHGPRAQVALLVSYNEKPSEEWVEQLGLNWRPWTSSWSAGSWEHRGCLAPQCALNHWISWGSRWRNLAMLGICFCCPIGK